MKKIFNYIFIITISLSCNKNKMQLDEDIKVDSSRIAILNYNPNGELDKWVFSDCKNAILTSENLIVIETTLEKIVAKQNIQQRKDFLYYSKTFPEENYKLENFIINIKKYKRQYVTVLNKRGEKEVWVNLFCDDLEIEKRTDWKNKILKSHGGGSCFFNFKINLTTNKYYQLWFNAEA